MKVVVQQSNGKLFLRGANRWTASRKEAMEFSTALEAIAFCIRTGTREARLVGKDAQGAEVYLYPFGGDPAIKAELKKLRKSIRESRRLKRERQVLRARIDILLAEGKEKKKQFPFNRKSAAEGPA